MAVISHGQTAMNKAQLLTKNIDHLANSAKFEMNTINKIYSGFIR